MCCRRLARHQVYSTCRGVTATVDAAGRTKATRVKRTAWVLSPTRRDVRAARKRRSVGASLDPAPRSSRQRDGVHHEASASGHLHGFRTSGCRARHARCLHGMTDLRTVGVCCRPSPSAFAEGRPRPRIKSGAGSSPRSLRTSIRRRSAGRGRRGAALMFGRCCWRCC